MRNIRLIFLIGMVSGAFCSPLLSAQPSLGLDADTIVEVFQHNYLNEQQTLLMNFADEAVAFTQNNNEIPDILRLRAEAFRDSIYAFKVWEFKDPLTCISELNILKNEARQIERRFNDITTAAPKKNPIIFVLFLVFVVLGLIIGRMTKNAQS